MKSVDIKIGIGEALDRLSILDIKCRKIEDPNKKSAVLQQHLDLGLKLNGLTRAEFIKPLYELLQGINSQLWEVEDKIREHLPLIVNDEHRLLFAALAAQVPVLNDERHKIKFEIDKLCDSDHYEIKSYVGDMDES